MKFLTQYPFFYIIVCSRPVSEVAMFAEAWKCGSYIKSLAPIPNNKYPAWRETPSCRVVRMLSLSADKYSFSWHYHKQNATLSKGPSQFVLVWDDGCGVFEITPDKTKQFMCGMKNYTRYCYLIVITLLKIYFQLAVQKHHSNISQEL